MFLILLALCVLAVSAAGLGLLAFARPTPATTRLADLFGPLGAACGCALGMAGLFTDSWTGSLLWTQAWGLPVGSLSLGLDALSRVFLLPVFGLGFVCACAGGISLRHTRASEHNLAAHWLFYLLLVLGMAVVMMARDAVLFLLARRLFNQRLRYISLMNDYFPLFLILGVVLSGICMRYFDKTDIAQVKVFIMGLVHFSPVAPDGISPLFFMHLAFVSVLLLYFPFSKLMHMPGVFFSPTRNLPTNTREVRHVNPWNPPKQYFTYAEYEDVYRDAMADIRFSGDVV